MPRLSPFICLPPRLRRRARRRRMSLLLLLLLLLFVLIAPFYMIYKPPALLIRYFAHRWPDVLFHVYLPRSASSDTRRVVALTIDDAPSRHTQEILEVLAANDAHATFFVIGGQVGGAGEEALLADVVKAGHELGNHGMRDEAARELGMPELERQIGAVEEVIDRAYAATEESEHGPRKKEGGEEESEDVQEVHRGPAGRYYRPGSGLFNSKMRALVKKLGYRLVLGDVYPHDAQIPYAWLNARHILGMFRSGSIIICHDRRSWTAPMLKKVLPVMKKKGWKVVSLSELLSLSEEASTT
jgi:peptidoglycan/xylan/chitin deacetylase (PgdA/CDA1 family)